MYRLIVSELAHQELDNIVSYIVVQLANSEVASNFHENLGFIITS